MVAYKSDERQGQGFSSHDTTHLEPFRYESRITVEDVGSKGSVSLVNFKDNTIMHEKIIWEIGEDIFSLIDQYRRRCLLLSFAEVTGDFSSATFGKLITANKKVQAIGGKLVLCQIGSKVQEVLEKTELDTYFSITDTVRQGIKDLEKFLARRVQ
ncbi:MAG: STAS domain-containing protein [Candidatus Peribacteraceae bacterium]|nr:STAS domain-containing protein [Candidatus Peribacteraceae bacterium]